MSLGLCAHREVNPPVGATSITYRGWNRMKSPRLGHCHMKNYIRSVFDSRMAMLYDAGNVAARVAVVTRSLGRRRGQHEWWKDLTFMEDMWNEEELVTIFGRDGSVTTIPPYCYVHHEQDMGHKEVHISGAVQPNQELCVGSVFSISATNGNDVSRRIHVSGFCQSIDFLCEHVERAVCRRGGEILCLSREIGKGGALAESLCMAVAVPLLFGVPPEHEKCLKRGIVAGGGIIHRTYKEWFIV